jgi:hypothetical protein
VPGRKVQLLVLNQTVDVGARGSSSSSSKLSMSALKGMFMGSSGVILAGTWAEITSKTEYLHEEKTG